MSESPDPTSPEEPIRWQAGEEIDESASAPSHESLDEDVLVEFSSPDTHRRPGARSRVLIAGCISLLLHTALLAGVLHYRAQQAPTLDLSSGDGGSSVGVPIIAREAITEPVDSNALPPRPSPNVSPTQDQVNDAPADPSANDQPIQMADAWQSSRGLPSVKIFANASDETSASRSNAARFGVPESNASGMTTAPQRRTELPVRPSNDSPLTGAAQPADGSDSPGTITESPKANAKNRPPNYPREARKRHATGTVRIVMWIEKTGQVGDVALLASSGHPDLDQAAIDAARKWTFTPAQENGHPVACRLEREIAFVLSDN